MKRSGDAHERDSEGRESEYPRNLEIDEKKIDQVLADSFPASDAPPWTLGVKSAPLGKPRKRQRRIDR